MILVLGVRLFPLIQALALMLVERLEGVGVAREAPLPPDITGGRVVVEETQAILATPVLLATPVTQLHPQPTTVFLLFQVVPIQLLLVARQVVRSLFHGIPNRQRKQILKT